MEGRSRGFYISQYIYSSKVHRLTYMHDQWMIEGLYTCLARPAYLVDTKVHTGLKIVLVCLLYIRRKARICIQTGECADVAEC
jgi:hypothetical protein